jgi:rubredoxin
MTQDEIIEMAIQGHAGTRDAIRWAIKQALAAPVYVKTFHGGKPWPLHPAPVQEPVVFYRCNGCGHAYEEVHPTSCDCMDAVGFDRVEYYTTSPAAQRQWVGLTAADIKEIWKGEPMLLPWDMTRTLAIEAKLKEKNT